MYTIINASESKQYRRYCSEILKEACALLSEKGISAQFTLVGSGARNLITRNGNGPYDLDYNLEIIKADERYWKDLRYLKETVRAAVNRACGSDIFSYELISSDAKDSTSVLTTILRFSDEPQVGFSFDVAITSRGDNGRMRRLIHNKSIWGFDADQYTWNEVKGSGRISEKTAAIKNAGYWNEVRERYVRKKNHYLSIHDTDHPSYVVFIEAVNEVYSMI